MTSTVGTGVSVVKVSSAGAGPEGGASAGRSGAASGILTGIIMTLGSSISSCRCSRCSRRNCRSSSSIDVSSISSRSCSIRYNLYSSSSQLVSVSFP